MRVTPSSPTTGSTQVMQTPMPQAIDSSTAVWLQAPWAVATSVTAASIRIGPQEYTTSTELRASSAGSGSVTRPAMPTEPSSVVTVTDDADRLA
jgi:hypothetical protein